MPNATSSASSRAASPRETRSPLPGDAYWIPRLLGELDAPFVRRDARAAEDMEQGARSLVALAEMWLHPAALMHLQWSMLNLAGVHLRAVQHDWFDAWLRFACGTSGLPEED